MSTPSFDRQAAPPASPQVPMLAPVALLLVGSGFAALVYEVAWTRQLTYFFGATLYAVVTVLAAFMGGLALGAWWWGKRADRMTRPVMIYGFLELGIALAALLFPYALDALGPIWSWGYVALEDHWTAFLALQIAVVGALLLVPTFLMGGTLPVLLRALSGRTGSVGGHVGWLYASNTFGAVAGTYLSGFVLLAHLGLRKTTTVAMGVNVCVFLVALVFDRVRGPMSAVPPPTPKLAVKDSGVTPLAATMVLWLYGLSGGLALAYQVLWNRGLIFCFELMKNTTYVFSAILTVYLIGLAIGSAIMSPIARRMRDPLALFAALQILLGACVLISIRVLQIQTRLIDEQSLLTSDQQIVWGTAVLNIFLRTAAVIGPATLILGMCFPLANAAYIRSWGGAAQRAGRLYAFNTAGAILGSLAAGFLLIPLFGLLGSLRLLGVINLLIGLALVPLLTAATRGQRVGLVVLTVIVAANAWMTGSDAKLHPVNPEDDLVFYHEGRLATVSVVQTPDGYRELFVDNNGVAGTAPYILTDQKSLAHFPMLLLREPRSALTVGFGSGGCSYSYSLYDEIEEIHCVEITEDVLTADEYLVESNEGYTLGLVQEAPNRWVHPEDPRYRVIIDDARSYLQHCDRQYDIIATDCTDLRYKTNANLYDLEYFQICRDRITEDGMVVVWMPTGGLTDEIFRCAVNTFYQVFPHTSIWFMNNAPTHYVLFIGTLSEQTYDFEVMAERLALNPDVVADLEVISLEDPYKILSCFVTDERQLETWLAGALVNTEDFPIIEFEAPRGGYGQAPLIANTNTLLGQRVSVLPLVTGLDASGEALLAQYEAAVPALVEGLNLYRTGREFVGAALKWREALEINPADASVERLLQFEQLRRIIEQSPSDFVDLHQWRVWLDAHHYLITVDQTLERFEDALALTENPQEWIHAALAQRSDDLVPPEARLELAEHLRLLLIEQAAILRRLGRTDEAGAVEREALEVQREIQATVSAAGI